MCPNPILRHGSPVVDSSLDALVKEWAPAVHYFRDSFIQLLTSHFQTAKSKPDDLLAAFLERQEEFMGCIYDIIHKMPDSHERAKESELEMLKKSIDEMTEIMKIQEEDYREVCAKYEHLINDLIRSNEQMEKQNQA